MDLSVVEARHSVRAYSPDPLSALEIGELEALIDEINRDQELSFSLVTDEPDAFGKSMLARYGHFSGVRNYIVVAGRDKTACRQGYNGQRIVLRAQQLGLNTCWVGLSYNSSKVRTCLPDGFKISTLIAVGHGVDQGHAHKSKAAKTLCKNYDEAPDFVKRGTQWVMLAPTALNQQKFRLQWLGGRRMKITPGFGFYVKIDMGIAMCHFELGAGCPIEWQ